MRIGIPTEIKDDEYRVALTPTGARTLASAGHQVLVQSGAGLGSRFSNDEYAAAGAELTVDAAEVWGSSDLVCKVKEPIAAEYGYLRSDLSLFTYLHMAADRPLTDAMLESGIDSIAYENVTAPDGSLPLLAPMSEIAGRLATQVGAHALLRHHGGRGVLLSGVPGTEQARVVVIGGGVAGRNAVEMAVGLGADVTVLDVSIPVLRHYDDIFGGRVHALYSTKEVIEEQLATATLVIGAVLIPGAKAPKLVSTETIHTMVEGSVLVDIAVDQGGCFEPTRPTTHHEPTFREGPALMYCVANMPGAVPRTATMALTNATLPYIGQIAEHGIHEAMQRDPGLRDGYCTGGGELHLRGVAEAHGLPCAS